MSACLDGRLLEGLWRWGVLRSLVVLGLLFAALMVLLALLFVVVGVVSRISWSRASLGLVVSLGDYSHHVVEDF